MKTQGYRIVSLLLLLSLVVGSGGRGRGSLRADVAWHATVLSRDIVGKIKPAMEAAQHPQHRHP